MYVISGKMTFSNNQGQTARRLGADSNYYLRPQFSGRLSYSKPNVLYARDKSPWSEALVVSGARLVSRDQIT